MNKTLLTIIVVCLFILPFAQAGGIIVPDTRTPSSPEGDLPYNWRLSGKYIADDQNQQWLLEVNIFDANWYFIKSDFVYYGYNEYPNVLSNRIESLKWDTYYTLKRVSPKQNIQTVIDFYQSDRWDLTCR